MADEGSWLWLAHGSAEGLGSALWAAEKQTVLAQVQPGRNDFNFYVLDEATVFKRPNGDTCPLLASLGRVNIKSYYQDGAE